MPRGQEFLAHAEDLLITFSTCSLGIRCLYREKWPESGTRPLLMTPTDDLATWDLLIPCLYRGNWPESGTREGRVHRGQPGGIGILWGCMYIYNARAPEGEIALLYISNPYSSLTADSGDDHDHEITIYPVDPLSLQREPLSWTPSTTSNGVIFHVYFTPFDP